MTQLRFLPSIEIGAHQRFRLITEHEVSFPVYLSVVCKSHSLKWKSEMKEIGPLAYSNLILTITPQSEPLSFQTAEAGLREAV